MKSNFIPIQPIFSLCSQTLNISIIKDVPFKRVE